MMVSPVERAGGLGVVRVRTVHRPVASLRTLRPKLPSTTTSTFRSCWRIGRDADVLAIAVLSIRAPAVGRRGACPRGPVSSLALGRPCASDDRAASDDGATAVGRSAEPSGRLRRQWARIATASDRKPIVLALDFRPGGSRVGTAKAGSRLRRHGRRRSTCSTSQEIEIVGGAAIDRESLDQARAFVDARLADLRATGLSPRATCCVSVADHANIGRLIAEYAARVGAALIVIGEPTNGAFARILDESSSQQLLADAPCDVLIVGTEREPELLTPA